ncbi:hypothetical protein AB0H71_32455 [Nocardia sp. NPDC050697]|uniref:hypothetical protein n=1 Tax=Nocardia sp. NPDC050697 TaxID=3155158 RepID=UPI0033E60A21
MVKRVARVLVVVLVVLLGGSVVSACGSSSNTASSSAITDVACDLTGPLVKLIAMALKIAPKKAIGDLLLDLAMIPVSAGCKHWIEAQDEPTTAEEFLTVSAQVPVGSRIPASAGVCRPGYGEFDSAAVDFATTSCPFGLTVHNAFLAAGASAPVTVLAWSPVTGGYYEMSCAGDYPVVCRGGREAVVYIY